METSRSNHALAPAPPLQLKMVVESLAAAVDLEFDGEHFAGLGKKGTEPFYQRPVQCEGSVDRRHCTKGLRSLDPPLERPLI